MKYLILSSEYYKNKEQTEVLLCYRIHAGTSVCRSKGLVVLELSISPSSPFFYYDKCNAINTGNILNLFLVLKWLNDLWVGFEKGHLESDIVS